MALVLETCLLLGMPDLEDFWALPEFLQRHWQAHVLNRIRGAYDGQPRSVYENRRKRQRIPEHEVADAVAADLERLLQQRDMATSGNEPLTRRKAEARERALDILEAAGEL